jgi:hypothetical protein
MLFPSPRYRCLWLGRLLSAWGAALAIATFLAASDPALASQGSGCMPTTGVVSGLTFAQDVNAANAAFISNNSGGSAPVTHCSAASVAYQWWADTSVSPARLRMYDGANWLNLGWLDTANHYWVPALGGGLINNIASAAATDLCSTNPALVQVTGTTTITSFSNTCQVGQIKVVVFTGILTLTNSANLILPNNGANITTAAGDQLLAAYLGSGNWRVLRYQLAAGAAVNGGFGVLTNLASAATTDLGTVSSHNIQITGTTTITSFRSSAQTGARCFSSSSPLR